VGGQATSPYDYVCALPGSSVSHRGTVRAGSFESDSRLALGLYKCSTMGILPTGTSDWLQFETRSDVRILADAEDRRKQVGAYIAASLELKPVRGAGG
jgi:hypothetical protein